MDHVATLLLELGLLFLGLSVLGIAARRIGLSPIPFVLVGALTIGEGGLVPLDTAAPFIATAAEIGVVLLLLTLGLVFNASELTASLRRHGPSGLVDLVLNTPPGFVAGPLLGLPWQGALALAGVTYISSSGIIARLLGDLGRLGRRRRGRAGVRHGAARAAGRPAAGHRLGRLLSHPDDEQVLLRLLGVTLLVAGLAQAVGASAAVGAFLVGRALPASFADRARSLVGPLRYLFAATFFVAFGLSTDPAAILPVLPAVLLLALVTTATEVGTGWYAARRDGIGVPGRLRAGTALVARGEFSNVIAGLAVAAGMGEVGPVATG